MASWSPALPGPFSVSSVTPHLNWECCLAKMSPQTCPGPALSPRLHTQVSLHRHSLPKLGSLNKA